MLSHLGAIFLGLGNALACGLALLLGVLLLAALELRRRRVKGSVAFFHPFCDGGGGGERVLWCAVHGLQEHRPELRIIIYSASAKSAAQIEDGVKGRFGLQVDTKRVEFVPLSALSMRLIDAGTWPVLTVLGQSLGSALLGLEALFRFAPQYFVDTTGFAFSFPAARWLCGSRVVAYVHYPTMSHDMLGRVRSRAALYNNAQTVASSSLLTSLKTIYYLVFLQVYGWVGRRAEVVMANSSWTQARVRNVWMTKVDVQLVYPPADLAAFRAKEEGGSSSNRRENLIVSVAQFRPEKNQRLQLEAFKLACSEEELEDAPPAKEENGSSGVGDAGGAGSTSGCQRFAKKLPADTRLVLLGSTRNAADEALVAGLREEARRLGLEKRVEFQVNLPLAGLVQWLHRAKAAVHSMVDEHFGISLLEFLVAGVVVIAHNSGGPREDILKPYRDREVGMLASDAAEYARNMRRAVHGFDEDAAKGGCREMRENALASLSRFLDNAEFARRFVGAAF